MFFRVHDTLYMFVKSVRIVPGSCRLRASLAAAVTAMPAFTPAMMPTPLASFLHALKASSSETPITPSTSIMSLSSRPRNVSSCGIARITFIFGFESLIDLVISAMSWMLFMDPRTQWVRDVAGHWRQGRLETGPAKSHRPSSCTKVGKTGREELRTGVRSTSRLCLILIFLHKIPIKNTVLRHSLTHSSSRTSKICDSERSL